MELTILEKISVFKKRFEKLGVPAELYCGLPVCYGTDKIVDSLIKDLEEIRIDLKKESQEAFDLMNEHHYRNAELKSDEIKDYSNGD